MAKTPKSQDPANWRRGSRLRVGDVIAVWVDGEETFSPITEYLGKVPYMGVTNHEFMTECGKVKLVAGHEFAQGRYQV